MKHTSTLAALTVFALSGIATQAQQPTSRSNAKMKLFLTNYPSADANKDKELTVAEMSAFVMENVNSSATSENDTQLRKFLRHAPQADLNNDKILKKSELITYLGRIQ